MAENDIEDRSVERWYILRLPKSSFKLIKELEKEMVYRRKENLRTVRYFAPLFTEVRIGHANKEVFRPLCLDYVFFHESVDTIHVFRKAHPEYNLIKDPVRTGCFLFIPDREMEMFRFIARAYKNRVPCFNPDRALLAVGDTVRVTGGDFKGIEGTLITRPCKEGGRVIINVCNRIAVPTLTIPPQYIELISFADGNKHVYKALDRYSPRIRRAMRDFLSAGIDDEDRKHIGYFISKYGKVNIESEKVRGRYLAYMMMSHAVLGRLDETSYYARECTTAMPHITNISTRAALSAALFACTGDRKHLYAAKHAASDWDRDNLTKPQQAVVDDILFYEENAGGGPRRTPSASDNMSRANIAEQ